MAGPDQLTCNIITGSCAWQGLNDIDHMAGVIYQPVLEVEFFVLHEQDLMFNLKKVKSKYIVLIAQLL